MDKRVHDERWVNRETARYYEAHLCQDLLKVWGGSGSRRGRLHHTGVASYVAAKIALYRQHVDGLG
jgi:hypothetical protein